MTSLTVSGGLLLRGGIPIKSLGANTYSVWSRLASNSSPNEYIPIFDMLSRVGCKYVRIFGDGFNTGTGLGLYQSNPAFALACVQTILDAAWARGISVIWSLHWNVVGIASWKGEALSAILGASLSRTYLQLVVDTVVPAFKNHPAIAAWECGNELNGLAPTITIAQCTALASSIRGWIDAQDPGATIISGNTMYDRSAVSNQNGSYPDAGLAVCQSFHVGFNTQCAHFYSASNTAIGLNGSGFQMHLERYVGQARGAGQPLILSEFGADSTDDYTNRVQHLNMMTGFLNTDCQLGLIWNCDTSDYSGNQSGYMFNTTVRPWVLESLNLYRSITYGPVKRPTAMAFR